MRDDDVVRVFMVLFLHCDNGPPHFFWLNKGNDNFGVLEGCGLGLLGCRQKAMERAAGIHVITHDLARGIDPDSLGECGAWGVDRGEGALV